MFPGLMRERARTFSSRARDAAVVGPSASEEEASGYCGVVRRPRLHRLLPPPRHELNRGIPDGTRRLDSGQFSQ